MRASVIWRVAGIVGLAAGLAGAAALPSWAATATNSLAVTISVKSQQPKVTGDTWVYYKGANGAADGFISGQVSGFSAGETAALYAEPFGATSFTATGQSTTLTGTSPQTYMFDVTPSLATQYEIQVLNGTTTEATSGPVTVYVTEGSGHGSSKRSCSHTACKWKIVAKVLLPASAYSTESAKHPYLYIIVPGKHDKLPKYATLSTKSTSSKPTKINSGEYELTFHFTGPDKAYVPLACTKDSETVDGLGLPGRHGCGDKRVLVKDALVYLG